MNNYLENVWSNNKLINTVINVLIFLTAINIFHYGQLLLPLICCLIFIGNKNKLIINNKKVFIILVLFSIFFCLFSYENGFYSTMGFCLPMAYYIGSNFKKQKKDDLNNIVLLIITGMASHLLLNAVYEYCRFGHEEFLYKVNRYDIWTKNPMASTATATNSILLFSCLYYFIFHIEKKSIKIITYSLFLLSFIYIFVIRRRTPILILLITFFVVLLFDYLYLKNKNTKKIKNLFIVILLLILVIAVLYNFNILGLKNYINGFSLITVLTTDGLHNGRFDIFTKGLKYLPYHLFGGKEISLLAGNEFHDLLFDIYDYAGIIPFILMIIICVIMAKNTINKIMDKNNDNDIRVLLLCLFVGIALMLCVEPIMTGSSLFLIISIMIYGVFENN